MEYGYVSDMQSRDIFSNDILHIHFILQREMKCIGGMEYGIWNMGYVCDM